MALLSHPQKRIWYTEMMIPNTSISNLAGCVGYKENSIDYKMLEKAIIYVIKKHDALHIKLLKINDYKVIQKFKLNKFQIGFVNETNIDDWMIHESQKPFSMHNSNLFYFALIKNGYYFKYHHIICDAMSVSIINKEIYEVYQAFINNQTIQLNRPSFHLFLDREPLYKKSLTFKEDEAYWFNEFSDAPTPLDFKRDLPDTNLKTKRYHITFDSVLTHQIKTFHSNNKISLFRFIMSIMYIYFYRMTSNSDIVISTGHHNRLSEEEKQMAGMTVSTVPIRMKIDGQMNYLTFLKHVSSKIKESLSHQAYPFDLLSNHLRHIGADPHSLLDIMLNHIPSQTLAYEVKRFSPGMDTGLFNIKINPNQNPKEDDLEIGLDVRESLLSDVLIELMLKRIKTMIIDVIMHPSKKINHINILSDEELKLIQSFYHTNQYDLKKSYIDLFKLQVLKTPNKIAVVDQFRSITYQQLDLKSNQVANALVKRGVSNNSIIGVMVNRSMDYIISTLGILKAGAAFLPLDNTLPQKRIDYILKDANVSVLIIDKKVNTDMTQLNINKLDNNHKEFEPIESEIAYVIYTSGSTGSPKGVMVTHDNFLHFCLWYKNKFALNNQNQVSAYCNFMFDVSISEMFPPLLVGATVHILSNHVRYSLMLLNDYFHFNHIDIATLPTKVGETFIQSYQDSSIDTLTVCGEKLNIYKETNYEVINAYGPTETTVYASTFEVSKAYSNIPIGKPVDNMHAYVVNKEGHLQPIGAIGELWLSGKQTTKGYINEPELTNNQYVDDPYNEGLMVYKTGDLVKWLPDGNLVFLGRIDEQIKINGYRVECGEIEQVILRYPGIRNTVVLYNKGQIGAVYTTNTTITISKLTDFLKTTLPHYMIPSQIIEITDIPYLKNGKIDKTSLTHLFNSKTLKDKHIPPETITEQKLATIWKEILEHKKVSIHDDFFDSGGSSLTLMKLNMKIYDNFKIEIPLNKLFNENTIFKQAILIEESKITSNRLVLMKEVNNDSKNLFCIHDLLGDVLSYGNIITHLRYVNVYGILYTYSIHENKCIEDIASDYIKEIKKVQPKGPYSLLGYSSGGAIVYEMAQQLRSNNECVNLVGLLDTPNYHEYPKFIHQIYSVVFRYSFRWILHLSLKRKVLFLFNNAFKYLIGLIKALFTFGKYPLLHIQNHTKQALLKYKPSNYEGEVILFKTTRNKHIDEQLGWHTVKNLKIYHVEGNHLTVVDRKHSKVISEILNRKFERIEDDGKETKSIKQETT